MINQSVEKLVGESFFDNFESKQTNLTWRPAGIYLHDYLEIRLESNRKGECSRGELHFRSELLSHPLLKSRVSQVAEDFLRLALDTAVSDFFSSSWLEDSKQESIRVGKLTVERDTVDDNRVIVVRPASSFLAGIFSR